MGLQERRELKAFQDEKYQELHQKILQLAGEELIIEVDWPTLCEDDMSHMYSEAFPKVYFNAIIEALEGICIDDMGKEAVREGLTKIIVQNKEGITNAADWAVMSNKILTLDHKPFSNQDFTSQRTEVLQEILEKSL